MPAELIHQLTSLYAPDMNVEIVERPSCDDLATWLERQYFHDDWNPDDTSQAALSHALAVMVAAHNGEISDSLAIGRAGSLPAPRSSAGGETGAQSRLSDHHATGRAVTPLEPLA